MAQGTLGRGTLGRGTLGLPSEKQDSWARGYVKNRTLGQPRRFISFKWSATGVAVHCEEVGNDYIDT